MNTSSWQYLGYILTAVGSALALSGSVALFYFQQDGLLNTRYSPSFLPILITGILFGVLGALAFFRARQEARNEIPPPPPPPPPQTLPPPPP